MNLGTKKSYYVFSKTDIKKFKEENNKPLEYIDLIKLVIDTNSELLKLYELNTKSVEISKFNKNDSLIHSQLMKLPLEADTDFDKILVNFNETKPPKIGKATKVDKATKDLTVITDKANYIERKDFEKISIKKISKIDTHNKGFPDGSMVKNLPPMQDTQIQSLVGKIPWGRKRQLQYSCLENSMDRGA